MKFSVKLTFATGILGGGTTQGTTLQKIAENKWINCGYKPTCRGYTLPKANKSHLTIGHPKRKLVFQPSIFRCELLVSGRVLI